MPILQADATEIPHRIRYSAAARGKRIIVTPDEVEVVAPVGQSHEDIAAFMHTGRHWRMVQTALPDYDARRRWLDEQANWRLE